MKKARTLIFFVAALAFFPNRTTAQGISKEQLVNLSRSGVRDSVIINQIQKDGVSFDVTPEVTIELKKLGLSDDVLNALIASSNSRGPGANNDITGLYRAGKYSELADKLQNRLHAQPNDFGSRALLVAVLLKMNNNEAADREFAILKSSNDAPAQSYSSKLQILIDKIKQQQQARERFASVLRERKVDDIIKTINEATVSRLQKSVLLFYFQLFQAHFNDAQIQLDGISADSVSAQHLVKNLRAQLQTRQSAYNQLIPRLDVYLYSPLVPSSCMNTKIDTLQPEFRSISISEYIELVANITPVAPLSDHVMDLTFHAELLGGKYEDVQTLGDQILAAKGNLKIPFYSSDRFFALVIDSQNRRLFTQADPHPFSVRYAGFHYKYKPQSTNKELAELVPFNVSFDEIKGLSQRDGTRGWTDPGMDIMVGQPYALKVDPTGLAPNYALMEFLHCTAGGAAQRTATRNLGQFLLHVIGHDIKASLADPSKGRSGGAWSNAVIALYGAYQTQRGHPELAQSMYDYQKSALEQGQAAARNQEKAWYDIMTTSAFSFAEEQSFADLEHLVGIL